MKPRKYKIKKVSFTMMRNGPTKIGIKIYSRRKKKIKKAQTAWPLPWTPLPHKKILLAYDIA
jgi:hypothetical protein